MEVSEDESEANSSKLARPKSTVAPTNEVASSLADEHQQPAPAEELHQLSAYELQRLANIRRNKERLVRLGLDTLKPATADKKKRKKSGRKGEQPPPEKRPRSSRLQAKEVVASNVKQPTVKAGGRVPFNPNLTLRITFAHLMAQIEKCHPNDDDGGKRGRFSMAKCLEDGLKQYMVDGCPIISDDKTDYVSKILMSAGSSENQVAPPSLHRLVHLPKTSKFLGAQIVASKCDYPQFACRGGCRKRVRTYCSCSPGVIICNECFVPHTIKCDTEAAAGPAL